MDKRRIKTIIPFLRKVENKYSPEKVILFGSRARGDFTKDSDYDIIVVSKDFQKIDFYERAVALYHLKRGTPAAMDIICLTPEEFEHKKTQIGTIQEAVREGIIISST